MTAPPCAATDWLFIKRYLMANRNLLNNLNVLIVEDELLIALDVERVVLDCGAAQCWLANKRDLAAHAPHAATPPDLLVIDYRTADNNWQQFDTLLALSTPVIVLSTDGKMESQPCEASRIIAVAKPFSDADLMDAFAHFFG